MLKANTNYLSYSNAWPCTLPGVESRDLGLLGGRTSYDIKTQISKREPKSESWPEKHRRLPRKEHK